MENIKKIYVQLCPVNCKYTEWHLKKKKTFCPCSQTLKEFAETYYLKFTYFI